MAFRLSSIDLSVWAAIPTDQTYIPIDTIKSKITKRMRASALTRGPIPKYEIEVVKKKVRKKSAADKKRYLNSFVFKPIVSGKFRDISTEIAHIQPKEPKRNSPIKTGNRKGNRNMAVKSSWLNNKISPARGIPQVIRNNCQPLSLSRNLMRS